MPIPKKEFSDLNLDMEPNPISGDLVSLTGIDAVKRSVRNVLLTNLYERQFRPNIGNRMAHLLFENVDPLTKYALKDEIYNTLAINEPRAKVIDVAVNFEIDDNRYDVTVYFSVENLPEEIFNVSVFLERVR